jgi:C4-dicarboxylate transporter DctQ subunit
VVAGYEVVEFSFSLDEKSDSSLQFPVFIYYLIIPISFALISFHYFVRLFKLVFLYDAREEQAALDSHGFSSVD